ncbi:MAG: hypothetical protein KDK89_22220 [Alphaproteobacteria bacterium]|nr:hypothetical protein [Alphaproteobacteria bacterium]
MRKTLVILGLAVGISSNAQAAPTDVVFQGGVSITSTVNCPGWNPDKDLAWGTYWVPVAGSTNGPDSVITFHFPNGTAEGFELGADVFTSTFKPVTAYHVYTRVGKYAALARVAQQVPATLSTTTPTVTVRGAIKNWDRQAGCIVNFTLTGVRDLRP